MGYNILDKQQTAMIDTCKEIISSTDACDVKQGAYTHNKLL